MIQVDRKNLYMIGGGIKSDNDDDSGKDKNKTWIRIDKSNYSGMMFYFCQKCDKLFSEKAVFITHLQDPKHKTI